MTTLTPTAIRDEALRQLRDALATQHDLTDEQRDEYRDCEHRLERGDGYAALRWACRPNARNGRRLTLSWSTGIYIPKYGHVAIDAHAVPLTRYDGREPPGTYGTRYIRKHVPTHPDVRVVAFGTRGA